MEINELKKECRKETRQRVASLSEAKRAEKSFLACMNVIRTQEFKNAKTILLYKPMKNECDPTLIASAANELKKTIAYPICTDNFGLKALAPKDDTAFLRGAYGIWEPKVEDAQEVRAEDIDLVIVPGVAFDENMGRLGRGAGYYDRFLVKCKNAVKIGFAFKEQVMKSVPISKDDIKMDKIVSDI